MGGGVKIEEADSVTHLGIVLSCSRSSLNHTLKCVSSARSAFFSLHSVGPRFGCLHPTTSLFKAFPLSILQFGFKFEVIFLSQTEILMLEEVSVGHFEDNFRPSI